MNVKVFTTGGTIDKVYFDARSDYEIGDPQIGDILRDVGVTAEVEVETLMRKDSLDLTDDDRALIAERVHASSAPRILITHGTDTMAATARALGEVGGKTVVFVGSLSPARFKGSDAEFNIGFALAAVQTLPAGAWVAMNGLVFPAEGVKKNRSANRFEGEPYQAPVSL